MQKKYLVIYHGDCPDGMGSALAAYLKLGDEAEYFPGMYDGVVPDVTNRHVMIFDYHFKEHVLLDMQAKALSVVLKDHHDSAQKIVGHLACTHFDNSKSGAVLAWEHFFDAPVPEMFLWLQDRDLFQQKYPQSSWLHHYLGSLPYGLVTWKNVYERLQVPEERQKILQSGQDIERYFRTQCDLVVKHHARPITLNSHEGWIVNAGRLFASDIGNQLAQINQSFALVWSLTHHNLISCSVRSVGDCSAQQIAEAHGGGGHYHAAKFNMVPEKFMALFLPS